MDQLSATRELGTAIHQLSFFLGKLLISVGNVRHRQSAFGPQLVSDFKILSQILNLIM